MHDLPDSGPLMLQFSCESCGETLEAPAACAGMRAPCPLCGACTEAPNVSAASPAIETQAFPDAPPPLRKAATTAGRFRQTGTDWPTAALAIVLTVLVIASLGSILARTGSSALTILPRSANTAPVPEPRPPTPTPEDLKAELLEILAAFLKAPNTESRKRLVTDPERVGKKMESYYLQRPTSPSWAKELEDGLVRCEVHVEPTASPPLYRLDIQPILHDPITVYFSRRQGESALLDWESLVGMGDMTLDEFIDVRPFTPTKLCVYLSLEMPDLTDLSLSDHVCVRLTNADRSISARAYLPTQEPGSMAPEILSNLSPTSKLALTDAMRVTLSASHRLLENDDEPMIFVDHVLHAGWLPRTAPRA